MFNSRFVFVIALGAIHLAHSTSPVSQTLDQKISAALVSYENAKVAYQTQGPEAFWKEFLSPATEQEIQQIVAGFQGYQNLPQLVRSGPHAVTLKQEGLADIVIALDTELYGRALINGVAFDFSEGVDLEELLPALNNVPGLALPGAGSAEFSTSLEDLLSPPFIPEAHARAKPFQGLRQLIGSFFRKVFGKRKPRARNKGRALRPIHAASALPTPNEEPAGAAFAPSPSPPPPANPTQASAPGGPSNIPAALPALGDECTVVYVRHADRHSGTDTLTTNGEQQRQALVGVLKNFEATQRRRFDVVLTSNLGRAKKTAAPFAQAQNYSPVATEALNECENNSECETKANNFLTNVLPQHCKKKPNGEPSTVLIFGHESFGKFLLRKMTGEKFPEIRHAEPHVLTRSSSREPGAPPFKLVHRPG